MLPFIWKVKTNYMWDDEKVLFTLFGISLMRYDLWCQDCGTWKYSFVVRQHRATKA